LVRVRVRVRVRTRVRVRVFRFQHRTRGIFARVRIRIGVRFKINELIWVLRLGSVRVRINDSLGSANLYTCCLRLLLFTLSH